MQRVVIEFVLDLPNMDVAGDVETRIGHEHTAHLCEIFRSVTGYAPLMKPGQPGLYVMTEPVTWNEAEQDWIGPDDDDNDDDDDDDK